MCAFSRSKDFFLVVISLTRATQILVRTCHTTKCYKHNDRNKKTQQQNKFQTRMSQWPATPAAIIQTVTSDKSWHVTLLATEQLLQKTKGWNRRMVAKHEYSKRFPWNQLKRSQRHKTKRGGRTGITCELNVHPDIKDMSVTKNNNKNSKGRQGLTVSHYSLFSYPTWLIWQCQWCEQILLSGVGHTRRGFLSLTLLATCL